MAKGVQLLQIGMTVFPKGLIVPQVYRVADVAGGQVDLTPISLGAVPMRSPAAELRRYRYRPTDEVTWKDNLVEVLRLLNPFSDDLYTYEVVLGDDTMEVPEYELALHEGSLAPNPVDLLAQGIFSPCKLVTARMRLLETFFAATARSMGIVGYNGARMLPIPHQINAARYALQFGRMRFLFADEVGLGKTVEAGLVVATLRKYFPEWETAIFVPESLTAQWAFEMYGKFGKMIFSLTGEEDEDDEGDGSGVILPHESARPFAARRSAEILIIDEAHRILHQPELVEAFRTLSAKAHAVLLLTATPVSDDAWNLLRLFQILEPDVYTRFRSPEEIRTLQEKQRAIEDVLREIRTPHPSHDGILAAWRETGLRDEEIERHLEEAQDNAHGRHELHRMAALIIDRYYPGARMLRYRRKFLEEESPLPFRIVDALEYKPTAEELAVFDAVSAWLSVVKENSRSDDEDAHRVANAMLRAAHSSPLALADWIAARRGELEPREGVTADPIRLIRRSMDALPILNGEDDALDNLAKANERWLKFTRAIDATLRPLARSARFESFLQFLTETFRDEPESHLLVFTSFESNVHPLYLLARKALTGVAEVFEMTGLQTRIEREKNAFEFQEHLGGSVLIADELGGEGRNFQFATHVVHYDLPFAPWVVEQRIGRCDRVGRDEEMDVDSVVVVGKGQLDEAVFDFLVDGVGVFNESIAPVEGELDGIMRRVMRGTIEEGATGILEMIEEVSEQLAEARERENADLLVRERVGVEEARRIATELDDAGELQDLRAAVLRYARLYESMVDEQENGRVAITVGEFHSLHGMPGIRSEMIGYFDRKSAVRHERQDFFSPGHPFVRSLTRLAMVESPDRASVVVRPGLAQRSILCSFRISIDPDFFAAVRDLPADVQPALLSKSAHLFATRMERLAFAFDGDLLPREEHPAAHADWTPDDRSLDEDPAAAKALLPDDWETIVPEIGLAAENEAVAIAHADLAEKRAELEDLICEVLTRVHPETTSVDAEVANLMSHFDELVVELDAMVALFPAKG